MTRNGGKLDLTGSVSGTDSTTSNAYLSNYSVTGYTSANFASGGSFTFNRLGLFLGDNADATNGVLTNSSVTTNDVVPEPASLVLLMSAVAGGLCWRKR
jgi:hypothetical protein